MEQVNDKEGRFLPPVHDSSMLPLLTLRWSLSLSCRRHRCAHRCPSFGRSDSMMAKLKMLQNTGIWLLELETETCYVGCVALF